MDIEKDIYGTHDLRTGGTMIWGDLFAGGGGATTGALSVPGVKVAWALNHSPSAIATHAANHPETKHYQADILLQDEHDLEPVDGIWMSSECTNYSIAKGGKLLDQGSRTLPMELIRFAKHCNPKVIIVENVKEFVNWGPLENGRPAKSRKGETFREWVDAVRACGYPNYEHRMLNAADYGAYTSRLRYFGVFTAGGIPICFPEQTHSKKGDMGLLKWNACKRKLDFSNHGKSIYEKKLCENTIKRIEAGLEKFGGSPFVLSFYGSNGKFNGGSIDAPLPTLTTKDRHAIVRFISSQYSTRNPKEMAHSIDLPIPTLTTSHAHMLITQYDPSNVFFRFITIDEAKVLQGFPEEYKLVGTKAQQLRHIGNSVVPLMAQKLIESNIA